jgi:hypothetical protein
MFNGGKPVVALAVTFALLIGWYETGLMEILFDLEPTSPYMLNRYCAWLGMVCAHCCSYGGAEVYIDQVLLQSVRWKLGCTMVSLSLVLLWWTQFGFEEDTRLYAEKHAYVFVLPLAAYWLGRSVFPQYILPVCVQLGQLSLELYVLQNHLFLCRNAADILVMVPGYTLLNLLAITPVYLTVAYYARLCTQELTQLIGQKIP